jgi:hypothetical protein
MTEVVAIGAGEGTRLQSIAAGCQIYQVAGSVKACNAFSWRQVVGFAGSESLVTFRGVHEIHEYCNLQYKMSMLVGKWLKWFIVICLVAGEINAATPLRQFGPKVQYSTARNPFLHSGAKSQEKTGARGK